MAYREVGMFEVKEVLRLWFRGTPKKTIARTVGVDVKSVRRWTAAAAALSLKPPLDDLHLAHLFASLRGATAQAHGVAYQACESKREFIKKHLRNGVRLTKIRKLLERAQVKVPYSTLHRFCVAELEFGRRGQHSVRLVDPPAGSELQIDTGWVVTLTVEGRKKKKRAFIFTPSLSRYRFVYPVETESTQTAIEACEAAWAFYGGIFNVLLPDNTKAIVIEASATSPRITEGFLEYAQARDFVVDPARVRKPKDKARVERTVSFVRDDCFGGEILTTMASAQTRALFWSEHEAGLKIHGTTKRRPKEHFLAEEQHQLQAQPEASYDIPLWAEGTLDHTQHIAAFGALYMLPERLIGKKVKARADSKLVRFYEKKTNAMVKVLPRVERGGRAFDKEDIPEHKRAYALRDDRFLADQAHAHTDAIGQFADKLLEGRAPWLRMRRVAALLGLVRRYGSQRVDEVCQRALEHEMHDVDRIRRMLEQPSLPLDGKPTARVIPISRYLRPKETWAIHNEKEET